MKAKLICQNCYNHGETKTICEILPSGFVSVERRNNKGYGDHTVINGSDFIVVCGNCGNTILKRERRTDESTLYWQFWATRNGTLREAGTIGTLGL